MSALAPPSRLFWRMSGLAGLVGAWALGHAVYGPFVLPRPEQALLTLLRLFASGAAQTALIATGAQALSGWLVGCAIGFALAVAAGLWLPVALAAPPVAIVLMGVPPIAWIVLALLWFGPDGPGAGFTVAISILPLVFVAVLQGMNARAAAFDEMAVLFRAPPLQRFSDILFPQLLAQLLPAAASALGYAWKICVMSEVLGSGSGIGGRLAAARANLDLTETMAWILLIVMLALVCDLALVAPFRRWFAAMNEAPFSVVAG